MPKLDIRPFTDDDLDAAAGLLSERHRAHRAAEPLLPHIDDFRPHVEEAWHAEGASGWVATDDGRMVGYLIGSPRGDVWGDGNVWVELAGHAVSAPEIVRDLYAAAAAAWVESGVRRHYAIVPATDRALIDAWFRLSFGAQHAMAIREVPAQATPPGAGLVVRDGVPPDIGSGFGRTLDDHQQQSPVFSTAQTATDDDTADEWASDLADERAGNLVAELDGRPVSVVQLAPLEYSGMHTGLARAAGACILGYAATLPEARGAGAGVALTNAAFVWAREHGYETIAVDWRETNLLASRFWPARGFRRTFQRLYRSIL